MMMSIMGTVCDTSAPLSADKQQLLSDCESDVPRVFKFVYHRCIKHTMDVSEIDQPFPCYKLMPGNDKLKECMDKWARRASWVGIDVPALRARVITNYAAS
ncbi:unnamed protein product [Oppiella nova]|uniref:Uncharacterized protein n=1 Tax=Oppiella nova TaxID=334625 RepID=A0A7R9MGL8_9ACAR|nr:unnamed protein product [Oppiella nova]CAG2176986.1 unnamed protein product [Oppiella nova]